MQPFLPPIEHLSLPQQVAQMLVVRASGFLFDPQILYPLWEPPLAKLQEWIGEWGVGGVILLGGSAGEVALRSQQLQDWATVPLLICADVEEGVGQRFAGATWFPPPMAWAEIAQRDVRLAETYAEQFGAVTAQEAQAIGLNWILTPTVDVNNNPDNPVINVRAFGEDPDTVGRLTAAFIRGAQQQGVLTVAKHFPGHGDTHVDSHLDLPVIEHSLSRLDQVELVPFRSAIQAGVESVMTAHLRIPALDPDRPATLSRPILDQLLRRHLGFEGLIVTDALIMGAIADRYGKNEAPVMAVEAGADVLMMPADPVGAIEAVCQAVLTGRIPAAQIRASVERIWQAKQKVCTPLPAGDSSHAWESPTVSLEAHHLTTHLAQPAALAQVTQILQHSMRGQGQVTVSPGRNLILLDSLVGCEFLGRTAPAIVLPQSLGYQTQIIDRFTPELNLSPLANQSTLLQLFIRSNPFRDSAGLTQRAQDWIAALLECQQLQGLILYGSPYTLDRLLPLLPSDLPYRFSYGQMPQAQTLALQQLLGLEEMAQSADRLF